jgi:hypothetical protein
MRASDWRPQRAGMAAVRGRSRLEAAVTTAEEEGRDLDSVPFSLVVLAYTGRIKRLDEKQGRSIELSHTSALLYDFRVCLVIKHFCTFPIWKYSV